MSEERYQCCGTKVPVFARKLQDSKQEDCKIAYPINETFVTFHLYVLSVLSVYLLFPLSIESHHTAKTTLE
jgi:hypothetical protein